MADQSAAGSASLCCPEDCEDVAQSRPDTWISSAPCYDESFVDHLFVSETQQQVLHSSDYLPFRLHPTSRQDSINWILKVLLMIRLLNSAYHPGTFCIYLWVVIAFFGFIECRSIHIIGSSRWRLFSPSIISTVFCLHILFRYILLCPVGIYIFFFCIGIFIYWLEYYLITVTGDGWESRGVDGHINCFRWRVYHWLLKWRSYTYHCWWTCRFWSLDTFLSPRQYREWSFWWWRISIGVFAPSLPSIF